MVEQIMKYIYRIPVPLPGNPLKALNSYVILGGENNLIIDTGFRQEECRQALFAGIAELGIERNKTDIMLTHLHSDHSGLGPEIVGENRSIYMGSEELAYIRKSMGSGKDGLFSRDFFIEQGFSEDEVMMRTETNAAVSKAPIPYNNYKELENGSLFEVGDYCLKLIHTPGHTPGHICLYMEREKTMFLGDHLLFDITPNITRWSGIPDSLGNYLNSLDMIESYDVEYALPGHRNTGDLKARIKEIKIHHEERLAEAHSAVKKKSGVTAYQIAGMMTWSIRASNWDEFPITQKWFAVGECAAHLDYLIERGAIRSERDEKGIGHYFCC